MLGIGVFIYVWSLILNATSNLKSPYTYLKQFQSNIVWSIVYNWRLTINFELFSILYQYVKTYRKKPKGQGQSSCRNQVVLPWWPNLCQGLSGITRRLGGSFCRWLPILYMGCNYVCIKELVGRCRVEVKWGLFQFCWS